MSADDTSHERALRLAAAEARLRGEQQPATYHLAAPAAADEPPTPLVAPAAIELAAAAAAVVEVEDVTAASAGSSSMEVVDLCGDSPPLSGPSADADDDVVDLCSDSPPQRTSSWRAFRQEAAVDLDDEVDVVDVVDLDDDAAFAKRLASLCQVCEDRPASDGYDLCQSCYAQLHGGGGGGGGGHSAAGYSGYGGFPACEECQVRPANPGYSLCGACHQGSQQQRRGGGGGGGGGGGRGRGRARAGTSRGGASRAALCSGCHAQPSNPGFDLCQMCYIGRVLGGGVGGSGFGFGGGGFGGGLAALAAGAPPENATYEQLMEWEASRGEAVAKGLSAHQLARLPTRAFAGASDPLAAKKDEARCAICMMVRGEVPDPTTSGSPLPCLCRALPCPALPWLQLSP